MLALSGVSTGMIVRLPVLIVLTSVGATDQRSDGRLVGHKLWHQAWGTEPDYRPLGDHFAYAEMRM